MQNVQQSVSITDNKLQIRHHTYDMMKCTHLLLCVELRIKCSTHASVHKAVIMCVGL